MRFSIHFFLVIVSVLLGQPAAFAQEGQGDEEFIISGLQGENVYPFESDEMAVLFRNFDTITREVTNLPNGIRTVTRSSDPDVMSTLVSHVHGMINRVEQGDDPKVVIQSPTLGRFFELADDMNTFIEITDEGIVVEQTSTNPELVITLQTHAAEVTELSDRGIQAVRDQISRRGE